MIDRSERVRKKCMEKALAIPNADQRMRTCADCKVEFVAHYKSHAAFCCPCSINRRADYMRARLGIGNDPLPGFPRKEAFSTREEIDAYLAHEKIECLLCGRKYKALNLHLRGMHGIKDLDTYRMMYGLPLSYGLVGSSTSALLVENGKVMWAKNGGDDLVKRMQEGQAKFIESGRRANQKACQAFDDERRMRMHNVKSLSPLSGENPDNTPTTVPCNKCGADFQVATRVAITLRCRLLCESCAYENWSKSKKAWLERHPEKIAEYQRTYRAKKKTNVTSGGTQ